MVTRGKASPIMFLAAAFAIFAGAVWQQWAHRGDVANAPTPAPAAAPVTASATAQPSHDKWAHVNDVVPEDERGPLLATLALIDRGGPFPYPKDGVTFSNREGRLPAHERGYYREYTVPTAGVQNRGARRVVQGRSGDTWYTNDHYESFMRIDR